MLLWIPGRHRWTCGWGIECYFSKSDRDRQISCEITNMRNLMKNDAKELIHKMETDLKILKPNLWLPMLISQLHSKKIFNLKKERYSPEKQKSCWLVSSFSSHMNFLFFFFLFFFFAALPICGNSWAKDQNCATAATQVTPMTTPDP